MHSETKKPKLKVGLVIDTSIDLTDGVQQYVKTLSSALKDSDIDVEIITGSSNFQSIGGIKVHSLAKSITLRFNSNTVNIPLWVNRRQIRQFWSKNSYDLLHIQAPYSPVLAGKLIKMAPHNVAIVATFHILPAGKLEAWGSKLLSFTYFKSRKRIGAVISVSQPAKEFAKKYFRFDSVVIPNAVNLARFIQPKGPTPVSKQRNVVFLGRLEKRKGTKELIEAYNYLPSSIKLKHKLIIAGDGPQREKLLSSISGTSLKNVKFLGFVSESEKSSILASARIACFPSLFGESFGIVLLEAMAAGSGTVLAGDNSGYKSVMRPMPEQIIEPKNSKQFAERIKKYLNDDEVAQKAQIKQSEYVKQFSSDTVAKSIIDVYHSTIDKLNKKEHTI